MRQCAGVVLDIRRMDRIGMEKSVSISVVLPTADSVEAPLPGDNPMPQSCKRV